MKTARLLIATVTFLAPVFGSPLLLVVPNAQTNVAGNIQDNNGMGSGDFQAQEVFGSGQFIGVGGDLLISQFAYRAAPDTGAVDLSVASMNIYLSTTQYAPNTNGTNVLLTDTFATNVGPDNTLVYSGPVSLVSPGCATAVCPFDMVVSFTTPFLYNPNQGKLLVYLQATGFTSEGGSFDAESFDFPPGGSVATISGSLGDTTDDVSTVGDIVQFGYTFVALPEPGTLTLAFGAFLAGGLRARIQRRAAKR